MCPEVNSNTGIGNNLNQLNQPCCHCCCCCPYRNRQPYYPFYPSYPPIWYGAQTPNLGIAGTNPNMGQTANIPTNQV